MIKLYWNFRTLLACALAAVAFAAFAATVPGFINPGNLYALLQTFAPLALVAVGLAIVMIAGEFDLSIAGLMPLAGLIAVRVSEAAGIPAGIAASILTAGAVGLLNGWLTTRFAVPSLAITVGTLVLTIGLGFAVTGGKVVTLTNYEFGLWLDEGILGLLSPRALFMLLLVAGAVWLMAKTWHGVVVRATGSDSARAAASGLPVGRTLMMVFVLSALFAGIAGSLQGLSLAAGSPGDALTFLLQVVTAAIIGGVALTGGKGQIGGVIAGALLLAVVSNGMSLQGTSTAVIQLVNGGLLLAIVIFDGPLNRLSQRSLDRPARGGRAPASQPAA